MRPLHYQRRKELGLTERQREVLELISRGKTNPEIADALDISLDGAKAHVRTVLEKLNAQSREEAAAIWRESRGSLLERVRLFVPWPLAGAVAGGAAGLALVAAVVVAFSPWTDDEPSASNDGMSIPEPQPLQAVRVDYRMGNTSFEVAYRDDQAWRMTQVRTPGAQPEITIYSDATLLTTDPETNRYFIAPRDGNTLAPLPLLQEDHVSQSGKPFPEYLRDECEIVGEAVIAGRDAVQLRCPDDLDVWVDASLGWMLKAGDYLEVLRLEVDPQFAPDEFALVPPPGYLDGEKYAPDASTQIALRKGEGAGGWTGTTLEGTPFSFVPGEGPTLLWFTASWCDAACGQYEEFAAAAGRAGDRVRFIAVFLDNDPGAVEAAMAPAGPGMYEVVLIPDANGHPWEPKSIPLLIALDGSGAVVEMLAGRDVSGQIESTAELVAR